MHHDEEEVNDNDDPGSVKLSECYRPVERVETPVGNNTRRLRELHGKTCQMITSDAPQTHSYAIRER